MNQVIHNSTNSTIAFLGLGSNLGDRAGQITQAIDLLAASPQVKVIRSSDHYQNPAIEAAGPNDFLNSVVEIETELEPLELLDLVLELELKIDPERNSRGRKLARKIDIDVLTYGELKLNHERLTLPHPAMQEREFVQIPLAELKRSQ